MNEEINRQNILEAALHYRELGLSVIPVSQNKVPLVLWQKYQREPATDAQIREWYVQFPDAGIGIVTGKISNIVVVDVEAGGKCDDLPITATSKTGGGGLHFYYRYPQTPVKNGVRVGDKADLRDVRGDGGYVVAPPSMHYSGNRYEWTAPLDDLNELAEFPVWIVEEHRPNILENDWREKILGVSEGNRNNTAAQIAGKLLSHLPRADWQPVVWPFLQICNLQNEPPMGEQELRTIFESIASRQLQKTSPGAKPVFEIEPWCEFDDVVLPPPDWLVNNLIPDGATGFVAAPSKNKKSWFLMALAHAIAQGTDFLGSPDFKAKKRNVLYVDAESPKSDSQKRARQLGFNRLKNIFRMKDSVLHLNNEPAIKQLTEYVEAHGIGVVIIDTFRAVAGNIPEEKADEIRRFINRLKPLKDQGVAFILLDHWNKLAVQNQTPRIENLFGSIDKLGAVDYLVMMVSPPRSEEIRVYPMAYRTSIEPNSFLATIKDFNEFPSGILRTQLTFVKYIELDNKNNFDAKGNAKVQIITYLIGVAPHKKTADAVKSAIGNKIAKTAFDEALKDLREHDEVKWDKVKGTKKFRYWFDERKKKKI